MMRRFLPLGFFVILSAPIVAQPAQSPVFEAARGAALTPGQWTYVPTPEGSQARFGEQFTIRCVRASRTVVLQRGAAAASSPMIITTDLQSGAVAAGGALASTDPVLDAIAFSRGRFYVSGGSAQRLVIPASPEAARSIEDCRI